jgi:hypothetical protein
MAKILHLEIHTPRVLALLVPRAGPVMEHAWCLHSPLTTKSLINKHDIQRKENITALTGVVSLTSLTEITGIQ